MITQRPKEDPITGETDVSPEFSVVIPTYNRVATLARSLEALRHARASWRWEVIVVIDGSTDETESYLQQLNFPCPLTAVLQPNSGAGAARNHGASRARGLFILFLDDDMTVDDNLLVEHHKVLTQGADAVVGDMPVHPDTPPSLLRAGVERWARKRRVRLERTKGRVTPDDFLTGQLSVRRDAFFAVGGFDVDFNANGTFGGEDVDFLHRFQEAGYKLQYSAAAKSYQRYVVTPEQYLRQWRQAGHADARLTRKHPILRDRIVAAHGGKYRSTAMTALAGLTPSVAVTVVDRVFLRTVEAGHTGPAARLSLVAAKKFEYWRGVAESGGYVQH